MGWIKKVPTPHVCSMPWVSDDIGKGSVWQCFCGKQYKYMGKRAGFFGYGDPKWEELIR